MPTSPSDPEKVASKRLERAKTLHTLLLEFEEKCAQLRDEIGRILGGTSTTQDGVKRVMACFNGAWKLRYKTDYVFRHGEDVPHIKRLIALLGGKDVDTGAHQVCLRAQTYVGSDETFYRQARHSFGLFVRNINEFAADALPLDDVDDGEAPIDCKHTPRCTTDVAHSAKRRAELRV